MGPRTPRTGTSAAATTTSTRVEVVRLPRRRVPEPPSTPLPPAVCSAVAAIVRDMRDVPRDCLVDRAEMVHWLNRMARRVEGLGQMRVPGVALPARPPAQAMPRPVTARDLAEAVFGKAAASTVPSLRTIVSRRGRTVRVEVRRARVAGQMELGF